jgi:hypothetical protein
LLLFSKLLCHYDFVHQGPSVWNVLYTQFKLVLSSPPARFGLVSSSSNMALNSRGSWDFCLILVSHLWLCVLKEVPKSLYWDCFLIYKKKW